MTVVTLRPGELLCELLDEDYETLIARIDAEAERPPEWKWIRTRPTHGRTPIRKLPDEERRAYQTAATRRFRSRRATQRSAGEVMMSAETIWLALADAAILILQRDVAGADDIRRSLADVFRLQPDAPFTIEARICAGRIRPRLWRRQ